MIAVRKCHSLLVLAYSYPSLLSRISSVHIDKVLASLRFRKVYVLKVSFSKNFLQITDINFPPIISYPNLKSKFSSKYKPSRF